MALKWYDYLSAAIDPNIAVEGGQLVKANGLFDGGKNSTQVYDGTNYGVDRYGGKSPYLYSSDIGETSAVKSESTSPAEKQAENVVSNNNTSADKAAQAANSTSLEWLREVMKYNAEQAEKNRQFQQTSADKAAQFESAEAQKLRDWQERMSNSQYQRAVSDLKKAGINPILAAQYLNGATTPSGASASGFAASGSSASASQTSAHKAEVDLNSAAKIITAYLEANTKLTTAEIRAVTSMFGSVLGALG